ncbi:hypothetical protein MCUN1_000385 [Malassezia cuniculi]|uniref:GOST seven transmembrane domain-containing protein n=1 Tax=Malassezia cuniculi TaxID=948313 RepID=A0AAF0ERF6_9BASI|nr:hypothetical protein MCUN1_000385 [Malassezia cuniculi]
MHVLGIVYLIAAACISLAAAYRVKVPSDIGYAYFCNGIYAGNNASAQVAFMEGGNGSVTAAVMPAVATSCIGILEETNSTGSEWTHCGTAAIAKGLCKPEDMGLFLLDRTNPECSSVTQWRVEVGKAVTVSAPVTKTDEYCIYFSSLSANVDTLGYDYMDTNSGVNNATYDAYFVFDSSFHGELPAAEYPKLNFFFILMIVYAAAAGFWAYLCFQHWSELVTLQHMMSFMMGFLVVNMLFQWLMYRYYNSNALDLRTLRSLYGYASVTFGARALIIVTTVLDAARNSTSFFLLLIVSMGYGVVRPTIGSLMKRVVVLAVFHFIFGVLYSVGIVFYIIGIGSMWTFFLILPLSITLSTFLVWTLVSLGNTISYLEKKRQTYKCSMFRSLYRILMSAAISMSAFLVLLIVLFSVFDIDIEANANWRHRWFALDGVVSVLYLVVFLLIAWIWRPTGQNMRLAMSDELATDENEAGDFEVQSLNGDDDAVEIGTEHLQDQPPQYRPEARGGVFLVDDEQDIESQGPRKSLDQVSDSSFSTVRGYKKDSSFRNSYEGDDIENERLRLSNEDLQLREDLRHN